MSLRELAKPKFEIKKTGFRLEFRLFYHDVELLADFDVVALGAEICDGARGATRRARHAGFTSKEHDAMAEVTLLGWFHELGEDRFDLGGILE